MYTIEQSSQFKEDMKNNIMKWAMGKIDQLCEGRPSLKTASPYLKRGIRNYI